MVELSRSELKRRLEVLATGLGRFPAGLNCPWPIARVFNEFLKQARRELPNDPIVKGMRYLEEGNSELENQVSSALTGTVELLVMQVVAALEIDENVAKPARKKPARRAPERAKA